MTFIPTHIKERLTPYTDVLLFVVVLFASNAFWKISIHGDETTYPVLWFGHDISAPFQWLAGHIALVVYAMIHSFDKTIQLVHETTLWYSMGQGVAVVWGCTALKQSFIWVFIMLFARGKIVHKLWYIPLGLGIIYLFNIVRIALITISVKHHPEMFEFLHTYLFKYLFYLILFAMWVIWVEKIVPRVKTRTTYHKPIEEQ